jgi:hypothetical protein
LVPVLLPLLIVLHLQIGTFEAMSVFHMTSFDTKDKPDLTPKERFWWLEPLMTCPLYLKVGFGIKPLLQRMQKWWEGFEREMNDPESWCEAAHIRSVLQ